MLFCVSLSIMMVVNVDIITHDTSYIVHMDVGCNKVFSRPPNVEERSSLHLHVTNMGNSYGIHH
jgi:hypothetical protein